MRPPASGPLRNRLFLLAASGLLPLALVSVLVLGYLTRERAQDAQQTALAVSRALATAVDAELRATMSVLQSMASTDELRAERLPDFRELAQRIAERQGWRAVVLADGRGEFILSTGRDPAGSTVRTVIDPESMRQAISSRQPVVGRVLEGPLRQGPAFAVRVPVLRDGELAYVLSAVIPAERVLAVIQRQKLPPTSLVSVFDRGLTRVARSRLNTSARPSPSLEALIQSSGAEGEGVTVTLEGVRSHTAFTRLPDSDWIVTTGISKADADAGLYGVLGAVGLGLLASLALAAFLAWYFARGVTEPIHTLAAAAEALGRGEPVQVPQLGIAELREVAAALTQASSERDRAAEERRAGEAERETLLARATEALHLAEEAGRSKDEFLAMLGHELRNPLAPMATALHLMARKGDERTRNEREVMERQVAHMKRLVDDLLDVSRITSKRLAMHFEPLRLADVVRHAAQTVQPVLGLRRFQLDITREGDQLWVSGDEVRLGQVLANLLGNAIKFTGPEASLALRLRRCESDAGSAEIVVEDAGFGMPPAVLEHVFDLFYQAPQGTDRSRGGLGLGLAIVRSLVEMHGGSVGAASEGEGRGSAFTLRLPTIAPPQAQAAPAGMAPGASRRARVLVVDDNQDAADTAAALLELSGYEVQVAYDPGVALALLDAFVPDVALLDVGLPGMSGYELAARVRGHGNGSQVWLVALTGYGTQADVAQAHAAGFARHLVKPATPDALLAAVEEGLKP
jgi:signal transduction histidine kinase